jgi:GMP reductase
VQVPLPLSNHCCHFCHIFLLIDAAHGLGGLVISDGGCTCPGDLAKAFGAGADFVMLGGMLAGHDESAGELVERDGKVFKTFYGYEWSSGAVGTQRHSHNRSAAVA